MHDPHISKSNDLMGCPLLERTIKHYSSLHHILLIGEGDFSFSLALANAFWSAENMVSTSLDSKEEVLQFYISARVTLSNLESLGALILHGVDATRMEKHYMIRKMKFHRIIFNFPHAGFYGRQNDTTVIEKHRFLLKMLFENAKTLLSEFGEIHVTVKEKGASKKWELVKQAEECGLLLKESVQFTIADYPGYINRRGTPPNAGGVFFLGECLTYKFVLGPDLLYKCELMAIQMVLPNFYSETSAENFDFKAAILEAEHKRQVGMAGEMDKAYADKEFASQRNETLHQIAQAWRVKAKIAEKLDEALQLNEDAVKRKETNLNEIIFELESERQARNDAETENADLNVSLDHLKVILHKELNKNDELKRQRDEALRLNENAIKRTETSFKEAILELESEREARKDVETGKIHLEVSLYNLKAILMNQLNKNDELKRQSLRQMEEAGREKTNIAKHMQKGILFSLMSSGLAFVLYLLRRCKVRIKVAPRLSYTRRIL